MEGVLTPFSAFVRWDYQSARPGSVAGAFSRRSPAGAGFEVTDPP